MQCGEYSKDDGWIEAKEVTFCKNERSNKEYYNLIKNKKIVLSRGAAAIADRDDYAEFWHNDDAFCASFAWSTVLNQLIQLKSYSPKAYKNQSGGDVNAGKISHLITDLSAYFKTNAYERNMEDERLITAATKTGNIYPQNMLMFTILTVQSIILLIAYIKRLFYVVLLGLMAPVVVVFDFFQRFGK